MAMDRNVSLRPGELNEQDAAAIFSSSTVAMVLTNPRLPDNPIVYVNRAFERLTGYASGEVMGRNCRFLQSERTSESKIAELREAIKAGKEVATVLSNRRADGEHFLNALLISPVLDSEGELNYFVGLQSEVESDKQADRLKQFETVMSEIQHRVKNHLSMILGLIRMKARESSAPDDYRDLSRRIESLQLLYEELSAASLERNDGKIQLGSYLGRVANAIAYLDGRAGVRMNVNVEPLLVDSEIAVRVGLVVSEILTNAMQHAFADQASGLVELRVTRTDRGGMRAIVTDDGVGFPEGVDWPNPGSLGGRIVQSLSDGLNATLSVVPGAVGTSIILDVPEAT
ncbi:PAS domain-containing protein [Marivita sp. GX14005]|uniref:PAS domain-containing protein n=1 Tax=Marivita sp. GX14005 TaxID=2942276 RepID=UPI0020191024|nr:PAS domain-containing protein [Marivita sp. GX14005]MCL3882191.1 PAS domain-containing protein [Marivita sp. GX14005]